MNAIATISRTDHPENDAQTGQPLWYWALAREGRENVLRQRAHESGATYDRDISTVGLAPDGEPPPKACNRTQSGPRMTAARRAAIEARAAELLQRGKRAGPSPAVAEGD